MLVVSRKLRQRIVIGDDGEIVVEVLGLKGQSVRIGIQADRSVPVYREELVDVPSPAEADPRTAKAEPRTARAEPAIVLADLFRIALNLEAEEPAKYRGFNKGYRMAIEAAAKRLGIALPEVA